MWDDLFAVLLFGCFMMAMFYVVILQFAYVDNLLCCYVAIWTGVIRFLFCAFVLFVILLFCYMGIWRVAYFVKRYIVILLFCDLLMLLGSLGFLVFCYLLMLLVCYSVYIRSLAILVSSYLPCCYFVCLLCCCFPIPLFCDFVSLLLLLWCCVILLCCLFVMLLCCYLPLRFGYLLLCDVATLLCFLSLLFLCCLLILLFFYFEMFMFGIFLFCYVVISLYCYLCILLFFIFGCVATLVMRYCLPFCYFVIFAFC